MFGEVTGPVVESDRRTLTRIHRGYVMAGHGKVETKHAELEDDFLDRFGVFGTPEYCVEGLLALRKLGIDKVIVSGPVARDLDPRETAEVEKRFTREVLPALSAAG